MGVHFDPKLRDEVVARYQKIGHSDLLVRDQCHAGAEARFGRQVTG